MKVMLLTSVPISPPWDQGDKNFAYSLSQALPDIRFRILSAANSPQPEGKNLEIRPRFRTRVPSLLEKTAVYLWLLTQPFSKNWQSGRQSVNGNSYHASPDLYHLIYRPLHLSTWLSRLLPDLRRHPTIQTIPATADEGPMDASLFFADQVVTQSEHGLQQLNKAGVKNVVRIPPGIDSLAWNPLAGQKALWKDRLQLDVHAPVILFPGHYGTGQGADTLAAALPEVFGRHPGIQVLFACRLRSGQDRQREAQIKEQLASQGAAGRVRYYNTVADMRPLIGASDLVVLPLQTMRAKVDIPTTLLEAMAAGRPIILSDIPPMNEILHSKKSRPDCSHGIAVPPGDPAALSAAINELISNKNLRSEMGKRGIETVQAHFDIRRIAQRYHQIYTQLLS